MSHLVAQVTAILGRFKMPGSLFSGSLGDARLPSPDKSTTKNSTEKEKMG